MEPVKKPGRPKKETKPVSEPKKEYCAAAEIIYSENIKREEAAEEYFAENMDSRGGLQLNNPECGGNIYFESFNMFPKTNQTCTCGNKKHFMVKYTLAK
jgi:hypothetical protein